MESTLTDPAAALPAAVASVPSRHSFVEAGSPSDGPVIEEAPPSLTEEALPPELLADLEDANLVLSPGYIGSDRRGQGLRARVLRATFAQRRSLLRLELLVVALVAVLVVASVAAGRSRRPRLFRLGLGHRHQADPGPPPHPDRRGGACTDAGCIAGPHRHQPGSHSDQPGAHRQCDPGRPSSGGVRGDPGRPTAGCTPRR